MTNRSHSFGKCAIMRSPKSSHVFKSDDVAREREFFGVKLVTQCLLGIHFLTIFLFSPLGIPGTSVRFTDLTGLSLILFSIIILLETNKIKRPSISWLKIFLFSFIALEVLLPAISLFRFGVEYLSSSIRAFFYWAPFLLALSGALKIKTGYRNFLSVVIAVGLSANLIVGSVDLLYRNTLIGFSFKDIFAHLAIDHSFHHDRSWTGALFRNSTQLAVFCLIASSHYLAGIVGSGIRPGRFLGLAGALILLILTESRSGLISVVIIFLIFAITFSGNFIKKCSAFLAFGLLVAPIVMWLKHFGFLHRFFRLFDQGSSDISLKSRLDRWPGVIEAVHSGGHTFTNPVHVVGLVDSGYLSYWAQGGFLFLGIVLSLLFLLVGSPMRSCLCGRDAGYWSSFQLSLGVFLLLSMIATNPMRDLVMICVLSVVVLGKREGNP